MEPLPIGLNRISWKLRDVIDVVGHRRNALPIGLNRISWKLEECNQFFGHFIVPTDWVKSD